MREVLRNRQAVHPPFMRHRLKISHVLIVLLALQLANMAYFASPRISMQPLASANSGFAHRVSSNESLQAAAQLLEAEADPGDIVHFVMSYSNAEPNSTDVSDLWINLTLDTRLSVWNFSDLPSVDYSSGIYAWHISPVKAGTSGTFFLNASVRVGLPPYLLLSSTVVATYANSLGETTTALSQSLTLVVTAPRFAVAKTTSTSQVQSKDVFSYRIYYNNSGNGYAGIVWINDTFDSRLGFRGTSPVPGNLTISKGTFSWSIPNVGLGSHFFDVFVEAEVILEDEGTVGNVFHLSYTDSNLNFVERISSNLAEISTIAPRLSATLFSYDSVIRPGGSLNVTIILTNSGRATAKLVWLNLSLNTALRLVSSDSPVPPSTKPQDNDLYNVLSWRFTAFKAASQIEVHLILQVPSNAEAGSILGNFAEVVYTDELGGGAAVVQSNTLLISVEAGPDTRPWMLPVGVMLLATIVILLLTEILLGSQVVEEVFLVRNEDGILVAHISGVGHAFRDPDIASGMFTAIQDFVRDSFTYTDSSSLRRLEFGEHRGIIARGDTMYLAVLFRGRPGLVFARRMGAVLDKFERRYGRYMSSWSGDRTELGDIEDDLRALTKVPRAPLGSLMIGRKLESGR